MDGTQQRPPEELPFVTLDNNALIALRRDEPDAPAVRELLAMNRDGLITVNVTMSTAFEAKRPDDQLELQDHIAWLESLGIVRGRTFTGPRSVGFATPGAPDVATFDPRLEILFTQRIHAILAPNMPFSWQEYRDRECDKRQLTPTQWQALLELHELHYGGQWIPPRPTPALDSLSSEERQMLSELDKTLSRRWINVKNDALGLENHITQAWHTHHPELSVFVTSDRNFTKATKIAALRALGFRGQILPPAEAVTFLRDALQPRRSA